MSLLTTIINRVIKNHTPYHIDTNKQAELILLCPARTKPCGGIKVLYRQAELFNSLISQNGLSTKIMHPKNLNFECSWFKHNTLIKKTGALCKRDVVIIPETMVNRHAPALLRLGIDYCIYVQNGYLVNKGNLSDLSTYYANAKLILSISDDSMSCIKTMFPHLDEQKIMRVHYSVDSNIFKSNLAKNNTITYMPRKLAAHSKLVEDFLKNSLPPHWQLVPIQNKSESETADLLAASKIFLSFSEFEGCPLPPVEAALCGNFVIGYTGEGAKEYFNLPAFTEIAMGDIQNFSSQILQRISSLDKASAESYADIYNTISQLSVTYSANAELNDLKVIIRKILPNINP